MASDPTCKAITIILTNKKNAENLRINNASEKGRELKPPGKYLPCKLKIQAEESNYNLPEEGTITGDSTG